MDGIVLAVVNPDTGGIYSASGSTIFGLDAGVDNTGENVVFHGTNTGKGNTGSYVYGLGDSAAYYNTGTRVIAVGNAAGYQNIGSECIFLGDGAGQSNSGQQAICLGVYSGVSSGNDYSVFIGAYAGQYSATNGSGLDIFIGSNAGSFAYGDRTIGIGTNALRSNGGNDVIGIGFAAGDNEFNIQGVVSNSIFLGSNPGQSNLNASGNIFMVYGTEYNAQPFLRGDMSDRLLGIGCTPSYNLDVTGSARITADVHFTGLTSNSNPYILTVDGSGFVAYESNIQLSNWSSYPANTDVNMSGYSISNVNNISTATVNASSDIYIAGVSLSGAITSLSGSVSNISGYVYTQIPSICGAITSLSGNVSNISGYVYTQIPSICGAITSLSGSVSNISGYVYTQIPSICGAITSLSGYVYSLSGAQFWANFAAVNNVNMSGFVISNISSAFISNNATISGTLTVSAEVVRNALNVSGLATLSSLIVQNDISSARTNYKYSNVMYVMSNGNDTTGIGSILNPFATISKAVSVLESQTLDYDQQGVIYVGPGSYGAFTISKGYLTINGPTMHNNQPQYMTTIGPITVSISGQTATYDQNQVILNGLLIAGGGNPAITNNSTSQHNLVIKNSLLNGNDRIVNQTASNATGTRFIMQDCKIQQDSSATSTSSVLLLSGNAWLTIDRCEITTVNKGAPLEIAGSTWLRGLANSLITCTLSSSTGTPPLVDLKSSTVLLPHTFASNSFFYQATNTKFTQSACAIAFTNTSNLNPTGTTPAIIQLYNNIFQLTGTNDTSNYVVKTYNTNNSYPVNSLYVFRSNNKIFQATGVSYASIIDPSISTSAISNLIGLGPNDPDTGSNWAVFPATQNVNMSGFVISNISSVFISNNATISGLATLSAATVQNNLSINQLNGATYPTTLGSTGQVLTISSTANTLYWATLSGQGYSGNVLKVDQVYGSDTLGSVGVYPYLTISKALSVASAGQMVWIMPGTYNEILNIPNNVSVRGANTQSVTIQQLNVTNSTTLITMGSNSRLEDVTLTLTSSSTPTNNAVYRCVQISNGNIPTSKLRSMVMNVNNFNPCGSAVGIYTYGDVSNPFNVTSADTIRGSTINVNTSGQQGGYATCIQVAGANRTSARDTNVFVTGTNCLGSRLIGCETVSAAALDLRASVISASGSSLTNCSLAEVSQTNPSSEIIMSYTRLQNHNANSLGFTAAQIPTNIVFGTYENNKPSGANGWTQSNFNTNYYMLPGSTLRSNLITDVSLASPFIIEQDCLLHNVFFSANSNIVSNGVMTLNIYHDDTTSTNLILSLNMSGALSNVSNTTFSYTFHSGDKMFVNLCGGGATGNQLDNGFRNMQVNIGLF